MARTLYALLLIITLALAACATAPDETPKEPIAGPDTTPETPEAPAPEPVSPDETQDTTPEEAREPDVTFHLTGENFAFFMDGERNPTLTVQKGDLVRIEFESAQGYHDWILDAFSVATVRVRDTDDTTSVEFVADEAGTFEYYCSVGSHREMGMFGTFVVEE